MCVNLFNFVYIAQSSKTLHNWFSAVSDRRVDGYTILGIE